MTTEATFKTNQGGKFTLNVQEEMSDGLLEVRVSDTSKGIDLRNATWMGTSDVGRVIKIAGKVRPVHEKTAAPDSVAGWRYAVDHLVFRFEIVEESGASCYWCGEASNSRDHVPPKALYPKGYGSGSPNLTTVPSCERHNSGFAHVDCAMVTVLPLFLDPDRNAEAERRWERSEEGWNIVGGFSMHPDYMGAFDEGMRKIARGVRWLQWGGPWGDVDLDVRFESPCRAVQYESGGGSHPEVFRWKAAPDTITMVFYDDLTVHVTEQDDG